MARKRIPQACVRFSRCAIIVRSLSQNQLDYRNHRCFCRTCVMCGESASDSPEGWCQFALKLSSADQMKSRGWKSAYHGTESSAIPKILSDGHLRPADGKQITIRDGHLPDQPFYFTTPSFIYAGFGLYATPFKVDDNWWQVIFHVLQRPASYEQRPETSGASTIQIDRFFSNSELEWASTDPDSNLVCSLLVRQIPNVAIDCPGFLFCSHGETWYQPFRAPPYKQSPRSWGANQPLAVDSLRRTSRSLL